MTSTFDSYEQEFKQNLSGALEQIQVIKDSFGDKRKLAKDASEKALDNAKQSVGLSMSLSHQQSYTVTAAFLLPVSTLVLRCGYELA